MSDDRVLCREAAPAVCFSVKQLVVRRRSGGDGSSAREVLTQGVYRRDSVILLSRASLWRRRDHEALGVVWGGREEKREEKRKRKEKEEKRGGENQIKRPKRKAPVKTGAAAVAKRRSRRPRAAPSSGCLCPNSRLGHEQNSLEKSGRP